MAGGGICESMNRLKHALVAQSLRIFNTVWWLKKSQFIAFAKETIWNGKRHLEHFRMGETRDVVNELTKRI
jgi:hypothetical protein